ncbi:hypothetical protein UP06_33290 [Bradyrhizobium sp. LTSP857]|nr:hypothetical protein UP06_33290 [Bradyrhizobium sp. LTSP857]
MGKTDLRSVCLHFSNRLTMLARRGNMRCGVRVSQFLSVLLLLTTLTLTVCFGVAAWRQSAGRDVDITATIWHQEGWRARPSD